MILYIIIILCYRIYNYYYMHYRNIRDNDMYIPYLFFRAAKNLNKIWGEFHSVK